MRGKYEAKSNNRKNKLVVVLCIILAVLLVFAVGAYIWMDSLLDGIGRFDDQLPDNEGSLPTSVLDPTDTTPLYEQADAIPTGKNVINVLLVGQDRREGQGRMHSDSMILCTLNKTTKTLTMTSFMRDMWVYIPEHYNERINVPYMVGGFDLLNATLDYNFGVHGDYNVEVDFAGFTSAIDTIGGVEIELTAAEARYLNRRGNWDFEENEYWDLVEGTNLLNGSQAFAYSRIRDIGDDFERTNRQRTVLTKLVEKAKTLSVAQLYDLVKTLIPNFTTDMSNPQIIGLMLEAVPMLSDIKIVSQRIPMDGQFSFANKGGASVIELSPSQYEVNKQLLIDAMKEE